MPGVKKSTRFLLLSRNKTSPATARMENPIQPARIEEA